MSNADTTTEALDDAEHRSRRKNALISLATFALCVAAVELGFRGSELGRKLSAESMYTRKSEVFSTVEPGCDLCVIGDSRALHGFHPMVIESTVQEERAESLRVYNAGLSGAPPMAHLAWIRRMLGHRQKRPRLVVLSMSPYMFSSKIARDPSRESLTTMYRPEDAGALLRARAPVDDIVSAFTAGGLGLWRHRPRVLEMLTRFSGFRDEANVGVQGWIDGGSTDPATQDARARGRAMGYRSEMWPPATFGNEQMGYYVESLRSLRAAGVTTVVINSPSASQLGLAYGPTSLYDRHIAYVREQAARFGAVYFDARSSPAIADEDFTDGDHLSGNGSQRYSAWFAHTVLVPRLGGVRDGRPAGCATLFDFESPLRGWEQSGNALSLQTQAVRHQTVVVGYRGAGFAQTFVRDLADAAVGEATSPPFTIDNDTVRLRVGGGNDPSLEVSLLIDEQPVQRARGNNDGILRDVRWDVSALRGRSARLRVTDRARGAWGHLLVDDVAQCPR